MKTISDLIGKKFCRLTVIDTDKSKKRYLICKCDCGNVISTFSGNITRGLTKSCGCLNREMASARKLEDLSGKQFGRLLVVERSTENTNTGQPVWICNCSCGNTVAVKGEYLRNGTTRSCGCLARELAGSQFRKWNTETEEKLSSIFKSMKQRCYDSSSSSFANWGGRGITICDEWINDKRAFVDWATMNGYRDGLTIDRIDNDGPYAPWNCRWVDRTVQANNRRTNVSITVSNVTHTLAEWARILGIRYIDFWKKPDIEKQQLIKVHLNNLRV